MTDQFKNKESPYSANQAMQFTSLNREVSRMVDGQQLSYAELSSKRSVIKHQPNDGSSNSKKLAENDLVRVSSTDLFKVCIQQLKKGSIEPQVEEGSAIFYQPPTAAYVLPSSKVVVASTRDTDQMMAFKRNTENLCHISAALPTRVNSNSSSGLGLRIQPNKEVHEHG